MEGPLQENHYYIKNGIRMKNARKKVKRKTKTNDAGLDDDGGI